MGEQGKVHMEFYAVVLWDPYTKRIA